MGLRSAGCCSLAAAAAAARSRCLLPTGRRPRPSPPAETALSSLCISTCHHGQVWRVGKGAGGSVSQGRQNQGGGGSGSAKGGERVGGFVLFPAAAALTAAICQGTAQLGLLAGRGAGAWRDPGLATQAARGWLSSQPPSLPAGWPALWLAGCRRMTSGLPTPIPRPSETPRRRIWCALLTWRRQPGASAGPLCAVCPV